MVRSTQKKEELPCKELKLSVKQVHYKKLMAYLLLLYRSYLKGETNLEPALKMAIWRMVQLQKEFALKIQLAQSELTDTKKMNLDADWSDLNELLFPKKETTLQTELTSKQENLMKEYKAAALELIQLA